MQENIIYYSTSCHPLFAPQPSKSIGYFSIYTEMATMGFFACVFCWLTSMCMYCIFSLRLCKRCWLCIQHSIENVYEFVPLLCICQSCTYKSAVAQSFVSVAEVDTSWYGPWHCQHEAPPLPPPQKLWLLKGSIHHWTSVLWFDTIVQILPFCPLSPRFLASDLFPLLSGFFFLSQMDEFISRSLKHAKATTCAACKSFLMIRQMRSCLYRHVHSLVSAAFPKWFHGDTHRLSVHSASVLFVWHVVRDCASVLPWVQETTSSVLDHLVGQSLSVYVC